MGASKCDDVVAKRAFDREWPEISIGKDFRVAFPHVQKMMRPPQLEAAIGPAFGEGHHVSGPGVKNGFARRKIHRPPVIRINQREIPQFGALVKIRHAGDRRLQRELAQRVQCAEQRCAAYEAFQTLEKF